MFLFTDNPNIAPGSFGCFADHLGMTMGYRTARQVERSRIGACLLETSHPSAGGERFSRWEVGMKRKKQMDVNMIFT